MKLLRTCFSFFLVLIVVQSAFGQKELERFQFTKEGAVFKIDPRIELYNAMGVILGNPGITPNNLKYKQEVKSYFIKHRNHPALQTLMKTIQGGWGIDGPIFFMLQLNENFKLQPGLKEEVIRRGGGQENLNVLANQIKDFYRTTKFSTFFNQQAEFYNLILKNTAFNFKDFEEVPRIEKYYGLRNTSYTIILNLLGGYGNFGNFVSSAQGNHLYAVIETPFANGNLPTIIPTLETYSLVFHEFSHSFVNHLVDKHRNSVLKSEKLFEPIKESMKNQGYDNWITIVQEHIVRATTTRLAESKYGKQLADRNYYQLEIGKRFIFVEALVEKLKEYEQNRSVYKNFNQFFPELIKVFQTVQQSDIDRLQRKVELIREPNVSQIPKPGDFSKDSNTVFVISTHEKDSVGQAVVNNYVKELKNLLPEGIKLISDDEALNSNLENKDIVAFGTVEGNSFTKRFIGLLPITITNDSVITNKILLGNHYQVIVSWVNPFNSNKSMIFQTAQQATDIHHYYWSGMKERNHFWVAENLVTIDKGDFINYMKVWLPER